MIGVLMQYGPFSFALDTAAYDELTRTSGWKWAEVERIGKEPATQFTGKESEKITMRGRLVPPFTGGPEQLERLRLVADMGEPMILVSGYGRVFGLYVIESIGERTSNVMYDGKPRMSEFDIAFKRYSDDLSASGGGIVSKLSRIISLFG